MPESFKQFGGIGKNGVDRNLSSRNLGSTHVARMNKLYANNLCIDQNVDISGNVVIEGTLDVSGHAQFCDVSACNVDISGNLRAGFQQFAAFAPFGQLRGAGEILNPRIYVDIDDEEKGDVIVGSGNYFAFTNVNDSSHNCVFGNYIRHNKANHHITSESIFMGDGCGRDDTTPSQHLPEIIRCGIFLGAKAKSGELGAGATSTNEIVIGCNTTGNGSNTAQIGNCDTTDVYLGCDGSGTTLRVDNIICHNIDGSGGDTHNICDLSACNVDISGNLRAGIDGLTTTQISGGVGSINNPRIICDVSDNVIIGEGALNGLNPSAPYTKQNVVIGKNAMFNHNTSSSSYQNVAVGDSALEWCLDAEDTVAVGLDAGSYFGGSTGGFTKVTTRRFGCTYIGAATFSKDNSVHSNETVIGEGAVGKGGSTVQLGNDNLNAVYLGDVSATTAGYVPDHDGARLYTRDLQCFERNKVINVGGTTTVLGYEDLFIKNFGLTGGGNIIVYPQTTDNTAPITPNNMPTYSTGTEGLSFVLNFYKQDTSENVVYKIIMNGGSSTWTTAAGCGSVPNTIQVIELRQNACPSAPYSTTCKVSLIWDGGNWRVFTNDILDAGLVAIRISP